MTYLVIRFGKPISIKSYEDEFLSTEQEKLRVVAKRLTAEIECEMIKLTINARDWQVYFR